MEEISEGKKKDLILEYILEQRDKGIASSSQEIQKDVFPELSIEDITVLLKEIEMNKPELIKVYYGMSTTYATDILFAKPFLKNGGFQKIESDIKKSETKEQLETELKVLQKESFEYQKTIREQNDRIRDLDEQIKFISLIKLYWWLIPTCIAIGIFLKALWDLLKL